jgi:mono/diheme cytochrome c family protein
VFKLIVMFPAMFLLGAIPLLVQTSATPGSAAQTSAAPATPAAFKVPPELAGKSNPVKPTPEGLAHARKMYGYDCAMCHGAGGDGKGDMVADMKLTLKDYRDPAALKDMSDGELFYIIQKGKDQMPAEGDRAKPDDIWNMVTLVRSFGKK